METELFTAALGIQLPFYVELVNFNPEAKRLDIDINFKRGSHFNYIEDGVSCECSVHDTVQKQWRHLNFFEHECYLNVRIPRVKLPSGKVRLLEVPWQGKSSGFTLLFEALLLQLCKNMPVNQVSQLAKVSDDKLWRMLDLYVELARELEDFSQVDSIGVDETSQRKHHNYISLFVNLETKKVMYVTEGKSNKTVEDFSKDLEAHKGKVENIKNVSCDMSAAFIKGVNKYLPEAKITFDKFHVIKIINEAVDSVRRQEVKEQETLKGKRYLFLKNEGSLSKKQKKELDKLSCPKLNLKTVRALHIRENFQHIYEATTSQEFETELKQWYFWATHSHLEPIKKAAKTIKAHWEGILNWFESKINNGILEGLNSILQAAKARARGYRTTKNFKIMAYLIAGDLKFNQINHKLI